MFHLSSRTKQGIIALLALMIVAGIIALPYALAQEDAQPIAYGENKSGTLVSGQAAIYVFQAKAQDNAKFTVLGFDFSPRITLVDSTRSTILAENQNVENAATIELSYTIPTDGTYYAMVSGVNATATGNFAIGLAQGLPTLPEGVPLLDRETQQGELISPDIPLVYDFRLAPDYLTTLSVRSLTGGYSPVAVLYTEAGEIVATLDNPLLLSYSLTLAQGDEPLKLVIYKGTYAGTSALVEVSLVIVLPGESPLATEDALGPTVESIGFGSDTPPSGCYVTSDRNVNIRTGGSVDHPAFAALGANRYLPVIGYNSANGGWDQVLLPDNRTGWVSSEVTERGGSCGSVPIATYAPLPTSTASVTSTGTLTLTPPTVTGTLTPPTGTGTLTQTTTVEATVDGTITVTATATATIEETPLGTEEP